MNSLSQGVAQKCVLLNNLCKDIEVLFFSLQGWVMLSLQQMQESQLQGWSYWCSFRLWDVGKFYVVISKGKGNNVSCGSESTLLHRACNMYVLNTTVLWAALHNFLEVPSSDKGSEIYCYLVGSGKCNKTLNLALPAYFHNLSNSLFCDNPTVWSFVIWGIDSAVK